MADYGANVWLDGEIVDRQSAAYVPLLTHTLHYGVGAFERQVSTHSTYSLKCAAR